MYRLTRVFRYYFLIYLQDQDGRAVQNKDKQRPRFNGSSRESSEASGRGSFGLWKRTIREYRENDTEEGHQHNKQRRSSQSRLFQTSKSRFMIMTLNLNLPATSRNLSTSFIEGRELSIFC